MPPPSTGLVAWQNARYLALADGAAVSSWPDAGPNGYAATQGTAGSQPAFRANADGTGMPGVQFDGTADFLSYAAGYLAASNNIPSLLLAGVVRLSSVPAAGATANIIAMANGTTTTNSRASFGVRPTTSWSVQGRRLDADASSIQAGSAVAANATVMVTAELDYANSDARVYVARTKAGENLNFQTAGNTSATNATNAAIGARGDGTVEWFPGWVFEVVTYVPTLSATDRTALWDWLEYQWLGGPAPSNLGRPPRRPRPSFRRRHRGLWAPPHADTPLVRAA